jgi:hypothetical protein
MSKGLLRRFAERHFGLIYGLQNSLLGGEYRWVGRRTTRAPRWLEGAFKDLYAGKEHPSLGPSETFLSTVGVTLRLIARLSAILQAMDCFEDVYSTTPQFAL